MGYRFKHNAAVAITILVGMLTLVQAAGAESLGLPRQVMPWLGIFVGTLGIALGFLPQVQRSPLARSQAYTATAATGLVPDDVEPVRDLLVEAEDGEPRVPPPRPPTGVEIKARERAESRPVSEPVRRRRYRREDEG